MAAIGKFFKTIRNNWKKSVFFTCVAVYGGKFLNTKYEYAIRVKFFYYS